MVRIDDRLKKIKEQYVDCGSYFVINRGRQYGKTTTLHALAEYLKPEYLVLSMDFQEAGTADFANESTFAKAFAKMLLDVFGDMGIGRSEDIVQPLVCFIKETEDITLRALFSKLSELCRRSEGLPSLNDCSRDQIALGRFDIAAKFNIEMDFSVAKIGGNACGV